MPAREELPATIKRSPQHAQDIWSETHDAAVDTYGEGERAHRTAFSALKHQYEKVGDHWEKKPERGPSDEGAMSRDGETAGGVNANATKKHLLEVAKRLDVRGRTRMTKDELVEAIQKANARASQKSLDAER
ncbi:ChaB family protein [Microbacterium yannicii]|jgi:cation transport regulator ChaB|uniref:ChaB family protein n=1 Tax=Microbacterium yannicii TaxID=671622 RepID=UPI0002E1F368|nr:ChaB family protein [Microbacterium yannicii]